MSAFAIGIDLGGTRIRAGLVDEQGTVIVKATAPTPATDGPEAVVDQLAACVSSVTAGIGPSDLRCVGLCAPGPLDADNGVALSIPTLKGFTDLPLAALLEEKVGHPVDLENDGIAAAYGEWCYGAGKGTRNLVYVTLSTGVGGGVVCDGRILRGRMGMASHVGHMTIVADGEPCPCGNRGCWEAYASGSALARRARSRAAMSRESALSNGERAVDARAVFVAAREGDRLAEDLVAEEADLVGVGIVNLLHLFSPERIVIGGGVANAFDALLPGILARMHRSALPPFRNVPITRSELGDDAGIVGVAALARERLYGVGRE